MGFWWLLSSKKISLTLLLILTEILKKVNGLAQFYYNYNADEDVKWNKTNSNGKISQLQSINSTGVAVDARNITQILNNLVHDYDKRLRPNYGGQPVLIGITMHVSTISAVSEVEMDYTVDLYLRQYWQDPRLKFWGINESITVGLDVVKSIWVPDTFFPNEKESFFHEATTHNSFLRINKDGNVSRSTRLTVTLNCPMNLEHFPMDKQNCSFEIESYGYSTRDILYDWAGGDTPLTISDDVHLAQFRVSGHDWFAREIQLSTGSYSRLTAHFAFERNIGFYLIQIYLPSSLIVIISWVSFWLNREATQARVAIGVTTVLTMTTLMTSTNASMPKVSYVKSIDLYLGFCFVIVFASLLEYAAVGYLMKRLRMQRERKHTRVYGSFPIGYYANQLRDRRLEVVTPHTEVSWANEETGFCQLSSPEHSPRPQSSFRRRATSSKSGSRTPRSLPNPHPSSPVFDWSSGFPGNNMAGKEWEAGSSSAAAVPLIDATNLPTYQMPAPSPFAASRNFPECDCEDLTPSRARARPPPKPIKLRTKYERQTFKPSNIDKYSRVLFPLIFISFHIIYWTIYLNTKSASSS